MGLGDRPLLPAAAMGCLLLAGCIPQTSRVGDDISTASLSKTKTSIVVMRVGAASPACINVGVLLGVREGEGYRSHRGMMVANVRSVTEPAVAEVELDPGEYHVIAYRCHTARGPKTLHDNASGNVFRTSFARFTVQPGEVVNVGYLHVHAARYGHNAFGRPTRATITVTDWPLADLDRYKAKRPQMFGQMTTRLMSVAPPPSDEPDADDCARLQALRAEGKVQQLPAPCQKAPPRPGAARG